MLSETIALLPLFSVILSAQLPMVELTGFQFGVGLKTATSTNLLGDLTGKTPSVGMTTEVRYYFTNTFALRVKGAFDNWGNQHIKGTIDNRCTVRRLSSTIEVQTFIRRQRYSYNGTYLCFGVGSAQWNIDSTLAELANQKITRPIFTFLFGGESRNGYLEFGMELTNMSEYKSIIDKNNSNGSFSNFLIAFGYKL